MGEVLDTEAQRDLPALLRRAAAGERITIVSDGRPMAELGPVAVDEAVARREAAWDALLLRLKSQKPQVIGPWTRDKLYERDWPDNHLRHCPGHAI